MALYSWGLLDSVSGHACLYRNTFPLLGYFFEVVYLRSLVLI